MLVHCWATVCDADTTLHQRWVNVSCLLGAPSHIPADARGTFDNHGQINDAVSLQALFTYWCPGGEIAQTGPRLPATTHLRQDHFANV